MARRYRDDIEDRYRDDVEAGPRPRVNVRRPLTADRLAANPLALLLGGLALLAVLGLVVYLALDRPGRANGQPGVADIADDPQEYYGQTVTVSGDVDEGLGPNAFSLEQRRLLSSRDVLVVVPHGLPVPEGRPAAQPLQSGDDLQVTGIVRPFVREDAARDMGLTLDAGTFRDWEGKPAIIASDVRMTK